MTYDISHIITNDPVRVPKEFPHFYITEKKLLDIPLKFYSELEEIRRDFGKFETLDEMQANLAQLSSNTLKLFEIILLLDLRSFLIERVQSFGSSYPNDLLQFVVRDGKILQESTISNVDHEGYLYSDRFTEYEYYNNCQEEEIIVYKDFWQAQRIYNEMITAEE